MKFLLPWLFSICGCFASASFGTDLQRWGATNTVNPTVITLSSGISAGTVAWVPFAYEAAFSMSVTNVSDSKGNTWRFGGDLNYSAVHRGAMAWSYITHALVASDTISITWSNHAGSAIAKAGAVFTLTGCSGLADISVTNTTSGTNVSASGTLPSSNEVVIGFILVDQVIVTNYTPAAGWTRITPDDTPGHSGSTDGLRNMYFYTNATVAGSYNPGGTMQDTDLTIPSKGVLWMAFSAATAAATIHSISGNSVISGNVTIR